MRIETVVYQRWGKHGPEDLLTDTIGGRFSVFLPRVGDFVTIEPITYEVTLVSFHFDQKTVYIRLK